MKKLRSLVAAVVAVACLYTPTATADPLSVELNALDSTIQVDGMAGDQPDGDAADGDQPDDNGVVESDGGALTSGSGEATVESEGADTVPEGADATPGEGDGAADDGPTADTPQAVDWTNAVDNLRLSTQGLTITPSVPADGETDADIAGTSVIPEGLNGSGVSRGAALGGLAESQPEQQAKEGAAQLPDAIDATLNLTFTLDAAAGDGRTDGSGLGTIVAGDHFSVPMPEGLATADEGSALDVFARDTDGNTTTVRVAEAKASDGVLTVTFTEPADAQAREAVTASIDVPVTLDAALVQDEVSTIEWTVRTMEDAEGNRQPETLTIDVPAKADVLKTLGLTVVEPETEAEDEETDDSEDKQGEDAEHGTEDESAANGLAATAEPLALPADEVTYALGSMNGTPRYPYQIVWCDNNYGARPNFDALSNGYVLQYSTDGGQTFKNLTGTNGGALTADAVSDFHILDGTTSVDWSTVTFEQTATNTWTLSNASGLPTNVTKTTKTPRDENGDGVQDFNTDGSLAWNVTTEQVYKDEKDKPQPIQWRIAATDAAQAAPSGYALGENDGTMVDGVYTRYFMLTTEVTFIIDVKNGDASFAETLASINENDLRFGASINNKPVDKDNSLKALVDSGVLTPATSSDGKTVTLTGTLPMYNEDGYPIVYHIQYTGVQEGEDYFQATSDNTASTNHGSATDMTYDGGTLTLRHAGTTSFTAKKDWLDGASTAEHPATTFTLWRYTPTRDKDGYLNASQVQLAALKDATNPNPGSSQINATSYVSITVPSSNEDTVDLGKLLRDKYGDTALKELPKYDPDGYPYVYCLREEGAPAGYEIVFGDYANGTFTDTEPSYQNPDGSWNKDVTRRDRPANNPFVYNNGTISNRRTGTVPTQVTKTWEVAAFQDQLQNVQVTLQAQSRRKYQEESQWQNVSGENAKQTLTDWHAESLTQTVEQTFPKYDEAGYVLEYRWLETGVVLGDQQTDFKLDETTGDGTFTLTLTDAEGNPEALEFTSERETDADGNVVITNSFLNETDETVIKLWEQPDGSYAQALPDASEYEAAGIPTEGVDFSGEVTVGLYQDGKLVGEYTLDGKTEDQPTDITDLALPEGFEEQPTWQETEAYKLEFEHLPKYTEGGVRHTYLVLEEPVTGWDTDRTYDAETRTTTITNDIGPGESSDIRISKQWIDGDDASHRVDVVVQLIARHYIHSQAKDEETGKYVHEYEAGAVVPAWVPGMDGPQEEIQIGFDDRWFQEVEVPMGGLTWEDFEIREIALVDTKNTPDTADDVRTPVVNYEDAQSATEYTGQGWLTSGWDETSDTLRVATDQHVYEVTTTDENGEPAHNADLDSLEVTNRRLGLFDLTVTKHWSDSDADPDTRPDAQISVSSPEYPNAFRMTDGKVYVSISHNVLPVVDKDGNQLTDANAKVEGGVLTVSIDKIKTDSEYTFFGLPKYDANGTMVHYEVEESWVGSRGEYSFSSEVGAYNIGPQHYHDSQTVKLDNTRGATRPVTFHKIWNDRYVNDELNQRPDIYLTLYRVTRTVDDGGNEKFSQPEAVDGYIRWLWQGEGTDESGGTDASYNQMATIEGLAKYDAEGNEYVYYATEDMAADGDALDYVDVRFDYSTIKSAQQQAEVKIGGADAIKIDAAAGDNPEENGVGWAIHEDGTFINTVQSELIANGTKLWENVPGITSQGDLPEITIYLQQRLVGTSSWPEMKNPRKDETTGEWVLDQGTIAQTSHITMTTNNQYTYTLTHEGINGADPAKEEGAVLQRYDDEGNLYEYRAIEVVWGLLDQPGGFTEEDIKDVDFATEESKLLGDIYTVQHGETGSFLIRNIYDSAKGNLSVKKFFTGRAPGDEYPTTTFDVYRYYNTTDDEGKTVPSASERVATKTFSGSDIEKLVGEDAQGNGSFEHTFTGLDIYAPDGSYWQYYVVERAINGYTTTVNVGNVTDAGGVTDQDANTGAAAGETTADIESPVLNPENGTPIKAKDTTPDVTFKNDYEEGYGEVKGRKTWEDYNDLFGVRPSVKEFAKTLTFTRTAGDMTEDVKHQTNNEKGQNYFTIREVESADKTVSYEFSIKNVEQYAPNGIAWTYTVTEKLSDDTLKSYEMTKSTGTVVSTNTGGAMTLTNSLFGQANVEKKWDPAEDKYGLQPDSVTVALQVNLTEHGASTGGENWQDAVTKLSDIRGITGKTAADNAIIAAKIFDEKDLSAGNGWKGSWSDLPTQVKGTNGTLYDIEYRAVETKIGKVEVTPPTGQSNAYGIVSSYQPSQETTYPKAKPDGTVDDPHVGTTTITNTLVPVSISATKTWSADLGNAWNTRPVTNGNWSVTYLLQRRDDEDKSWEWVLKYGATHEEKNLFDENIVSETITGNGDSNTVTWKNLPAQSDAGKAYQYRVVERVPGGYDVTDNSAESLKNADGTDYTETVNGVTYRYYVVSSSVATQDNPATQTFTNTLRTVDLQGTKLWNDYGTGFASQLDTDDMPKLTLKRKAGDNGTEETVKYITSENGVTTDAQPEWTKNKDGSFTFTYVDLPAANKNDVPYTYWAVEQGGASDGYYPLYGTSNAAAPSGASGTTTSGDKQTNETITNTATRFTLDKVSEKDNGKLNSIQLAVFGDGTDNKKNTVYAVWVRNADGSVDSWVNPVGAAYDSLAKVSGSDDVIDTTELDDADFTKMDLSTTSGTDNRGAIIGLVAGAYRVVETGDAPENHATAKDVAFTLNTDGSIAVSGSTVQPPAPDADPAVAVSMVDPLFRGHATLKKMANDQTTNPAGDESPLAGAVFSLYHDVNGDGKKDNGDSLVAEGLKTDPNGTWTSWNSSVEIDTESDIYDATYRDTLGDGLIPGKYYFIETSAPSTVYDPGNWESTPIVFEIKHEDTYHAYALAKPQTVPEVDANNALFRAKLKLTKFDAFVNKYLPNDSDGLANVTFKLEYDEAGDGTYESSENLTTGTDGTLTMNIVKKGHYRLTETTPAGYEGKLVATFEIGNEDYNRTYNLNTEAGQTAVKFTEAEGSVTVVTGEGVPNARILGSATLTKTDNSSNAPLNGVTFKLEREVANDQWEKVTDQTFETGKQYTLSDDNKTATVTPAQGDPKGKITVSNLWWGTYRFTEVRGLDGYLEGHENGDIHSKEFTIDARKGTASTNLSVAVTNTPTRLHVQKVDTNGDPLKVAGAVFEVKPVEGSSFVDDSKQSLTMTTDANGVAKLEEAQLILGNSYTLQEITAPEGYKKLPDTIEFTVNTGTEQGKPAGSITITKGATGFAADGANGIQLNVQNDPIELQLAKVDANGDAVSSVKFQLTAEGYATTEHTTDTSGNIVINTGLKAGVQYTLTEVLVPGGYTYLDPFTFTFNEYGKISAVAPVDGWSVADNQLSVTATNEFTDLTIQKYSNETNPVDRTPLAGAVFTVTPVEGSAFVDGSTSKTLTTKMNADNTIASDSLVGQLIAGNSYTIEETKAPAGYTKIDGTMTVTVQNDGSLKIADGTTAPTDFVIRQNGTISVFTGDVTNTPTEMSLAKIDASTNAAVKGAQFSLRGAFANGAPVQTLNVTSEDGRIALDKALLIADGTTKYTLTETSAPAGYETLPALEFTVAENGTITPVNPVAGWSVSNDGITITAADTPVKITLIKNGDDGATNLNGAVFYLYEGNTVTDTPYRTITTQNGSATIDYLTAGQTYTLIEHTAPAGYELMTEPVTFTVGTDGKIAFTNETAAANAGYAQSHDDATGVVTITATDHPVEIDLVKNGSDGKAGLNGAVFEVYAGESATGTPIATATTTNGALSFDKLTANATYTLHEQTAPAGYELMPDVTFTVDENGLINFVDAAAGYVVNESDGVVTITATDQLIEITLNKHDLSGHALQGAEFTFKGEFANEDGTPSGTETDHTVTVENGPVTLTGLIAGNKYTLTETTAPEGYELAGSFTFTVDADGTISAADDQQQAGDDEEGYRIEAGDIAITAQDTPIGIELRKRAEGENGKALAGAVFKVTPADGDNAAGDPNAFRDEAKNAGITLDVDADGVFDTAALDAQLVAGNSYVIEEVTPPAGYARIAGALTFTVDTDGAITAATGADNDPAFTIDTTDDVMTITAIDQPVEVTLNKVSSADPETKLDATFTLTGVFAADSMDGTAEAAESTRTIGVTAGTATLDRLIVGNTYVLRETKSQAGYEVIAGTLTFTVNADGTVTAVTADGNGAAIANDLAFGTVQNAERITATNTPVQISVAKVDEDGKPLEGAEFTLTGDMANADGTIESNHTWTVKPGADPAAVEGLIVTNGTDRHEYTLTEAEAPAGYESLGGITFTINPDGTITGEGAGYTVDGSGVTITAQDTAIKARLRKTDENGQPQAGATFEIQATLGGTFSDGNTSKQFTTGADGFVDLDEHWFVGGNSYVITEVTAPGGYELAGAATFTVNKDGTITFHDDADRPTQAIVHGRGGSGTYQASSTADGVAVITASNSPIAVQLTKVSGTTPLAGATFELTPVPGSTFADGSTEAQTITIESTSGATALTNLTANMTYILKETVPPAGYELNETEFTFTVAADGTITPTEAAGYTVTGDEIVTITVNDEPIEVTLTKRNADGAALEGAEFTLHGMFANADGTSSGTVADRTVVVENGTVALEGLIADQQYTLTETKAPEGYRVNTGTLTFTVNADGTLTEVESAEGYAIDADTATAITVIDQPTELDLTKLASDGTPLAGAEFTLAPDTEHDVDSRFVSDRSSIDLVVGEDGTVPTVTGELMAGHAYVLTETKAPDGYALITEPLHFTVGPKGRAATLTAGTELPKGYTIGGNKEAGTIALTAVDNPIELTLKKVNEDGDVLVGAEFTLSGRFADGTTQQILTTGTDGTVALPLIIGGERYVLEETKAPEGYVLPAERYTFTVGVDGVIRVQQNPLAALLPGDKTFSLSQDGLTITVVNEREPVVAITGSDVTSVGFIGFGLLLIGATIAMQRRTRMAQVAGNGKPARGRHRR